MSISLQNIVGKNAAYCFQSFDLFIKFNALHKTKEEEEVSRSGYQ